MDKNVIFMRIAKDLSEMSHCVSHKVGVILVKDDRILSTGINGTPKGFKNCDEIFKAEDFNREKHHYFSEKAEIHAETNSILFAARNGINIDGSIMYSTLHPCNNCLKMICNAGIKTVYYCKEYDKFEEDEFTRRLLKCCGVNLIKLDI